MTPVLAAEELNPLVPHLSEIIVGTIAFALLFWLLARTVFPQFERVYAERTDKIEGGLQRAEEAQEQAAALKRQYEEQLAGLRAEAARIRQRGEEQLAAQREQTVRQLRGEVGGLSVQLAERIIGTSLDDDDRRRGTVDAFLSELDGLAERRGAATSSGASTGGAS